MDNFFCRKCTKTQKIPIFKNFEKKSVKCRFYCFSKLHFFCAIIPKILTLYFVEVSPFFVLFQTCQKRQADRTNLLYQYVFYCLTIRPFYTEWGYNLSYCEALHSAKASIVPHPTLTKNSPFQ